MLQGTVVPAYFDASAPTDPAWSALEQAAASVPIVAVFDDRNVLGGVWAQVASAGIQVYGYVLSDHGQPLLAGVEAQVDAWFTQFPDLTGMFVDVGPPLDGNNPETQEPADVRAWYESVYGHVTGQHPPGRTAANAPLLMLNCGGLRDQAFVAACLDIAVWEQDYATYVKDAWWNAAIGQGGEWWQDATALGKKVVHVVQAVPQGDQVAMQQAIGLAQSRGADCVYVYDGTSVSYGRLPTFWDAEVGALHAIIGGTGPGGDGTVIARPQTPAPTWRVHGAADAATALARDVLQPDPVDAAFYVWGQTVGAVLEVSVGAPPAGLDPAEDAKAWFYANTGPDTTLLAEVVSGGQNLGGLSVAQGAGFAWRSIAVNQAALPAAELYLRFTVVGGPDSNVRAAYVELHNVPGGNGNGGGWQRTWYAPCSNLGEFTSIEVPQGTTDRLRIDSPQPARSGTALRAEVRDGDIAWNPNANNGQGAEIPGGWRAEAIGPFESQTDKPVRYEWSTMLAPDYVADPRTGDGNPTWQVITQWHQGDNDKGGPPPIAFIIVGEQILLDLQHWDPNDDQRSIQVGQWPVADVQRGQWHQFRAEIRWDVAEGTLALWHNGEQVYFDPQFPQDNPGPQYPTSRTALLTGLATLFEHKAGEAGESQSYLKTGIYRKGEATTPEGPFVLFHDEFSRWEEHNAASAEEESGVARREPATRRIGVPQR